MGGELRGAGEDVVEERGPGAPTVKGGGRRLSHLAASGW